MTAAATVLLLCASYALAQDDYAVVEGVVRNSVTKQPIAKASIHLIPTEHKQGYAGATSAAGGFRFENVVAGDYRLLVEKSGYSLGTVTVGLTPGQKLNDLEIALKPFGTISGTVLAPDGEPIEGARLALIGEQWQRGKRVYRNINVAETDNDGIYRFDSVSPGRYYLHAARPAGDGPLAGTFRESPARPEMALAGVYYPDGGEWEGRAPLDVFPGMALSRIDVTLHLVPVFHVRGQRDPDKANDGTGRIDVFLVRRVNDQSCDWDGPASARVQPDGSFDIKGVEPGNYYLTGLRRGYEGYPTFQQSARIPVTVTAKDLNGLRPEAVRWFHLNGHIQGAGPKTHVSVEGVGHPIEPWRFMAEPNPDGTFSIANLTPNRYTFRVAGDTYLKSIRYNGEEMRSVEIDLTGGPAGEVELVLDDGVGRVEGTVKDARQETRAVLVPVKVPLAGIDPLSAEVDPSGHFSFNGVPPGSYLAFGVVDFDLGLWENAEFLASVAGKGAAVDVPEKNTVHVDIGQVIQ